MPTSAPPRCKRSSDPTPSLARPAAELPACASADELEALRSLCHELVADLPQAQRHLVGVILLHARDRLDIAQLRTQLFDALARRLGERVARERINRLDAALAR